MELDRRQWHVRWFFWSLGIWEEFMEQGQEWRVEHNGTNLCHFMRVTLVWAPLVLLLNLAVYGAAISALTIIPAVLFGLTSYVSLVIAIVLIVGIVWGAKWYFAAQRSKPRPTNTVRPEPIASAPVQHTPRGPGFFEILWKYIVAVKKKFCPIITFRQPQRSAS